MIKLKVIACDVLNREISYLSSQSKCFVDVTFMHQGLHSKPNKMAEILQKEIDEANKGFPYSHPDRPEDYDYIILMYGLCGNGTIGLSSSKVPLVIPRAHDCGTLLIGSKEGFKKYHEENARGFMYSPGWIERGFQPGAERFDALYKRYEKKYGSEKAAYLMELEHSFVKEYNSAVLVNWGILGNEEYYRGVTKISAKYFNWEYKEVKGSPNLLRNILNGELNYEEVLILPPKEKIAASFDDYILKY
ncbi:hypothetical protein OXPF_33920 [Oxobacter pfennigii]|uniref:DUF1638 domain-containing protein n=1 Tax=Oxobacter pfennigii TaxID=36849 RepID=A0A0P8Y8S6_9CLOT|nr:DUF1638 domain-containing protein [Oxobacter pfennigii]KPU43142.1 hypothetical protein OXPF_33920 [Oxobacter pfennigii]